MSLPTHSIFSISLFILLINLSDIDITSMQNTKNRKIKINKSTKLIFSFNMLLGFGAKDSINALIISTIESFTSRKKDIMNNRIPNL